MEEQEFDLDIVLNKAIELLHDKRGIKEELKSKNTTKCRVNTNTYRIEMEITKETE